MSINADIVSETEIAKTCIMNSALDDNIKHNLIKLLQKSVIATNGISSESKIQNMTELMNGLIISISIMMVKSNQRLQSLEDSYFEEHPKGDIERLQHDEKRLREVEDFRNTFGMDRAIKVSNLREQKVEIDGVKQDNPLTNAGVIDKIFGILEKGYFWVFAAVAFCSPFAKDIIQTIIKAFQGQ